MKGKLKTNKDVKQFVRDTTDEVVDTLFFVVKQVSQLRIIATLFLLGWLIAMTYLLMRPAKNAEDAASRDRYFALHRVWFGDTSIVGMIYSIWYFTILLLVVVNVSGLTAKLSRAYFASRALGL